MPTYTYEVILANGKAGKRFEVEQKMADKPLTRHPKTGQRVRRIISTFAMAANRFDKTLNHFIAEDARAAEKKAEKKAGKKRGKAKR